MYLHVQALPPHRVPRIDEQGAIVRGRHTGYGPDGEPLLEGEIVPDHPLIRKAHRQGLLVIVEEGIAP
jgi:hypothetical protein